MGYYCYSHFTDEPTELPEPGILAPVYRPLDIIVSSLQELFSIAHILLLYLSSVLTIKYPRNNFFFFPTTYFSHNVSHLCEWYINLSISQAKNLRMIHESSLSHTLNCQSINISDQLSLLDIFRI